MGSDLDRKEQRIIETQQIETCVHHWIIETPGGPRSVGVCKNCGAEQDFPNSLGAAGTEKETPSERRMQTDTLTTDEGESRT